MQGFSPRNLKYCLAGRGFVQQAVARSPWGRNLLLLDIVGRQVLLDVAGDEFFIDQLFNHLKLRCYVVIELKRGEQ
jgi:predicted nuclease of restriction endonuclease-like (RecB) superfamily